MQEMYRRRSSRQWQRTVTGIITITKTVFDEVRESKFRIMMKKRGKVFIRQSHEYKCGLLWNRTRLYAWQTDSSASAEERNAFRKKN